MNATQLTYVTMPGPEFESLVTRYAESKGHPLYGLASPRLKYFERRSFLVRGPDERVLIMCVKPVNADGSADEEGNRFAAIGMLELEVDPGDAGTMWFKYLTVHPDYQRQGIAKRLLEHMVAVMQTTPRILQRSRSSDEGEQKIQAYIDKLLGEHGISWRQTGRTFNFINGLLRGSVFSWRRFRAKTFGRVQESVPVPIPVRTFFKSFHHLMRIHMPNKLMPAVEEALLHLKALADFAYQQGFHELGYDPVEAVRAALVAGAVPEGHVVLPRQMTPAMRLVAVKLRASPNTPVEGIYDAVLAAAPQRVMPSAVQPTTDAKLRDAVVMLRGALVQAEAAIKGREHTGFITKALNATAFSLPVASEVAELEPLNHDDNCNAVRFANAMLAQNRKCNCAAGLNSDVQRATPFTGDAA